MKETTKILMEEQERIKVQVNSWEAKLRKMEEEHNQKDEWRQRNNILISGIKECPQESYFDTLNMTEDILRMKLKVGISSQHVESVCRLGKERGGRPVMVRFILFMKKLELLHSSRNLAGTKIRIEQDYRAKVGEIGRLIPYLKDTRQQRNSAYI